MFIHATRFSTIIVYHMRAYNIFSQTSGGLTGTIFDSHAYYYNVTFENCATLNQRGTMKVASHSLYYDTVIMLDNSKVINNRAFDGGAILLRDAHIFITNTEFSRNYAT